MGFFDKIKGAMNAVTGNAAKVTLEFNPPLDDHSGLRLQIGASRSFALGEAVGIDLNLHTTDTRGKTVHPHLHPSAGLVHIAIRKPNGEVVAYEPMIEQCLMPQAARLEPGDELGETVYIGYGHDGLYFDQSGLYQLRAVYNALRFRAQLSSRKRMR